jgi:ribA/ribD-fused uncharacterized protein
MNKISSFTGYYRFLSNFYACNVPFDGLVYPSVEHAYQAAKSSDIRVHEAMIKMTASEVKKFGSHLPLPKNWEENKILLMTMLVQVKFIKSEELQYRLKATGDAILEEGNYWNDTFWGVDINTGKGENKLGKILMDIRKYIRGEDNVSKMV